MSLNPKPPASEVFSISEIYRKSSPLVVPTWQRDFGWSPDDHVQKLIDDFWEFIQRENVTSGSYYLLGQVILVPNAQGKNEIVDGQQRLTTIYLFLLCLLNAFKARVDQGLQKNQTTFVGLANAIANTDDGDEIRLELPFQDGTRVLEHLYIRGSGNRNELGGDLSRSQLNLLGVYDYFEEWIGEQLPDESSLVSYAQRVLNSVFFTRLVIVDIPQAMDYFEKMNRRGLPLAAADLLKNFLFAQVPEREFENLSRVWKKMSAEIEQIKRRSLSSTEMFIKSLAVSRHFQKINGTEPLLKYWKTQLVTESDLEAFRSSLPELAKFYRKVSEGKAENEDLMLEGVQYLNGSQHLPLLFAGRHLINFDYLCDLVDRRFIIYLFANERTAAFETMVPNWCKKLSSLDSHASKQDILLASRSAEGFISPNFKSSATSFIENLSYEKVSNRKKMRFVLAYTARNLQIEAKAENHELFLKHYLKTATKSQIGFDLDHILGQQYFRDYEGNDKILFHSIGALTPLYSTSHRQETHALPAEKSGLYETGQFVLTKSLVSVPTNVTSRLKKTLERIREAAPVDLANWNTESIKTRTTFIIDTFLSALAIDEFSPGNGQSQTD
jgi:hypothetical protein